MDIQGAETRDNYTYWHHCFYDLFAERRPGGARLLVELELSRHPSRADVVVLRDSVSGGEPARIFPLLWPRLSDVTVLEFKSPARGLRRRELLRFFRYGIEYHEINYPDVWDVDRISRVLVVPELNKALRDELAAVHAELEFFGTGYARLRGSMMYSTYVLFTNDIAEAENDEFLKIFSHHKVTGKQATQWLQQWMTRSNLMQQDVHDLEGHDEMLRKFFESLRPEDLHLLPAEQLHMLAPEQLRVLAPEQLRALARLLPPEQIVDALSDENLDALIALAAKRRKH